jgi:hypothetical protein
MYNASVKNIIKLDDGADKPDGKVFVASNEIPVGIVPAAGERVGYKI